MTRRPPQLPILISGVGAGILIGLGYFIVVMLLLNALAP